jgi:hypothetical protein
MIGPMTEGPTNPYMPPTSADTAMPPVVGAHDLRAELRGDTRGRRVAGAFFLATAGLGVVWAFAPATTPAFLNIVLDAVVGLLLVRGYGNAAKFGLFWIAIGMFYWIVLAFQGNLDPLTNGIFQAGGLTLLLIGNPGRPRFVIGCVLYGFYFLATLLGLALLMTGNMPP